MPKASIDTTPIWTTHRRPASYPALDRDLSVEVVVVGGGMTGITAAYLLSRAGVSVALLDRRRIGQGETSHTTAHLTAVTDESLPDLVDALGRDHAQAVWDAGFAAIAQIFDNARRESIECGFTWLPGYQYAPADVEGDRAREQMQRHADVALDLGFDARFMDEVPGVRRPGVMYDGQAAFHPVKYLDGLVKRIAAEEGCYVFEQSEVTGIADDEPIVSVGPHRVSADFIVLGTHVPLMSQVGTVRATLLQTDLYLYNTYAVAARIARGRIPQGLYWEETGDVYDYIRVTPGTQSDIVIFGGADHKTGQSDDTRQPFEQVEQRLRALLPGVEVTHRWSGQVVETRDGLPYIGEYAPGRFIGTGYSGNGMTFGTLAGMMAADRALNRDNPWTRLFDPRRTHLITGAWNYLTENKDYPYYMMRDRFAGADARSLREIRRGEGKIVDVDGKQMAVYRDEDGTVTRLSPICTHMGCKVAWNAAERSWDCPCHGSRFTPEGDVLSGPAERALDPIE
jgi:glycine/D-amino acid oxidase-like deaminating enzyme/nitrite reductase/ring-hydroxylating ferredoxin subunit